MENRFIESRFLKILQFEQKVRLDIVAAKKRLEYYGYSPITKNDMEFLMKNYYFRKQKKKFILRPFSKRRYMIDMKIHSISKMGPKTRMRIKLFRSESKRKLISFKNKRMRKMVGIKRTPYKR